MGSSSHMEGLVLACEHICSDAGVWVDSVPFSLHPFSFFFFFCIRFLSKVIMLQPKVKKLEKVSEV